MADKLTAIITSAGKGERMKPISLISRMRDGFTWASKMSLRVGGTPISDILLHMLHEAGFESVDFLVQHWPNRRAADDRYKGEWEGMRIGYSSPLEERLDNGSGAALVEHIKQHYSELGESILVLPNDGIFDADWQQAIKEHKKSGAIATILTVSMLPRYTIQKYGVIQARDDGYVTKLIEKPGSIEALQQELNITDEELAIKIPVNTAGYVVSKQAIMRLANEDWIKQRLKKGSGLLDMASYLLEGAVGREKNIRHHSIRLWRDTGSITEYLATVQAALNREFEPVNKARDKRGFVKLDCAENVWVNDRTLTERHGMEKNLEEMLSQGSVQLGPNVVIDSNVVLQPGYSAKRPTVIRQSQVDKNSVVRGSANISGSIVMQGSYIGSSAFIQNSIIGMHVIVEDGTPDEFTSITDYSAIGPQIVPAGLTIRRAHIYPDYRFDPENIKYDTPEMQDLRSGLGDAVEILFELLPHQKGLMKNADLGEALETFYEMFPQHAGEMRERLRIKPQ